MLIKAGADLLNNWKSFEVVYLIDLLNQLRLLPIPVSFINIA